MHADGTCVHPCEMQPCEEWKQISEVSRNKRRSCVTQVLSSPSAALGERLADEDEEDGSDGGGGDPRTGECKEDGSDGGSAARSYSLMKEKPECSVVAERAGEEGQ